MRSRLAVFVLSAACLLAACSGPERASGPRAPIHHVAASVAIKVGRSLVDLAEVVAWRAPKLLLYELPVWLFRDVPGQLALALASRTERVRALVESLEDEDEQKRLAAVEKLRELTGLPLEDAGRWREWWKSAADRAEERWLPDLVEECLEDLASEDFLVRQEADDMLRRLGGADVGFDAKAGAEERARGIERWRAWRDDRFGPGGGGR